MDNRTSPAGATGTDRPDPGALRRGSADAERRLVLLHGWGADADDLLDLGELLVASGPETDVVALRAPEAHPGGFGRQWYDLQSPGWPDLPQARMALKERLLALAASVPLERTVLLGFSQGAAMAVDVGGALPLAGLVACSGYPHEDSELLAADEGTASWRPATVLLLTHGLEDPIVRHEASEELLKHWRRAGGEAELLSFAGGHTIDESVLGAMRDFVARRLDG